MQEVPAVRLECFNLGPRTCQQQRKNSGTGPQYAYHCLDALNDVAHRQLRPPWSPVPFDLV